MLNSGALYFKALERLLAIPQASSLRSRPLKDAIWKANNSSPKSDVLSPPVPNAIVANKRCGNTAWRDPFLTRLQCDRKKPCNVCLAREVPDKCFYGEVAYVVFL